MSDKADQLREQIRALTEKYYAEAFPPSPFSPGTSPIPYAGRVFDEAELISLIDASLDFWLTEGTYVDRFEEEFADFFGLECASLVNSGSSANLLALCALTSPELNEKRIVPGDEVITTGVGFPTTLNPIIQLGCIPVFVDVEIPTYNIDVAQLEVGRSERTKGVMIAHTLGNPFNLEAVTSFCRKHDLWLIEDCCDAVGATYQGKMVGSFGDLATTSFYPPHHITMGEGGCVLTDNAQLKRLVESFRDWGRDCWCPPGKDNSCQKRFTQQLGTLPYGYDHKYIYSHIGYNLKLTDLQAAIGVAQLKKLPRFIKARKDNFRTLYEGLIDLEEFFVFPEATPDSEPSWFGFPLGVREGAPFTRLEIVKYLEESRIVTRSLFAGNLPRHPAYQEVKYRTVNGLPNSDFVMNNVFWFGVYPGLNSEMLAYMVETIQNFVRSRVGVAHR